MINTIQIEIIHYLAYNYSNSMHYLNSILSIFLVPNRYQYRQYLFTYKMANFKLKSAETNLEISYMYIKFNDLP